MTRTSLVHLNVEYPPDVSHDQIVKEIKDALEVGTDPEETPGLFMATTVVALAEEITVEPSGECEGHPAGPDDPMGETVFCDGSCQVQS